MNRTKATYTLVDQATTITAAADRIVAAVATGFFQDVVALFNQANFSDDEVFAVFKALTDTSGVTERAAITLSRLLADAGAISELASKELGKSLTEQAQTSDDELLSFGKSASDTASVSDALTTAAVFSRALSDTVQFADSLSTGQVIFRSLSDGATATDDVDGTASILDDQEILFAKFNNNTANVSDALTKTAAFSRAFANQAAASDGAAVGLAKPNITDVPSASDVSIRALGKAGISDSPTVSDVLAKTAGFSRAFADTASLADAGSLISQGYCDFSYFASDYVGATRTF